MPRKYTNSKQVPQPKDFQFLTGNKYKNAGGFHIKCCVDDLTKHPFYSESCPICLEDISAKINMQLNCGHNLCFSCISRLIVETKDDNIRCPCCRDFIFDILFQNRDNFKPIAKLCDYNWTELKHEEFLNYIYRNKYLDKGEYDNFTENYKYTWSYKEYKNKNKTENPTYKQDLLYRAQTHFNNLLFK